MILLTEKVDYGVINTLVQYYDPPLQCFTFSNFQLAPILEEVEIIVGQKLKDFNPFPKLDEEINPKRTNLAIRINVQVVIANWVKKGDFKGFTKRFLEELALKFKKTENWKVLYVVLGLLIHGIVLFPNIDSFVDHVFMEVFLSGNPMTCLLVDIYDAPHTRHE